MKKITLKFIALFLTFTSSIWSQSQGDIAFIGFNADGDKDFAIVALADLPANTTIYFTDGEPNVAGTGLSSNSEGVLDWNTGGSVISAGTVVVFTDIEASLTASVGTIADSADDAGFNISASGDNIFATLGNPGTDSVTVWIAGIENRNSGQGTNFGVTGLNTASTYVVIDNTASKDGGQYSGTRTDKTAAEFRTLIANRDNWTTSTSDGESILPMNATSFSFLTLSNSSLEIEDLVLTNKASVIVANKGEILSVYNMLGQKVSNNNLVKGVYVVIVELNQTIVSVKMAI